MLSTLMTDVLVIGGGGAGLRAGIEAAQNGQKVILISKGPIGKSGITILAGGGIQACQSKNDSIEAHVNDTIRAGRQIGDRNLIWKLASDAPARIRDLERYGVRFKKNEDGSLVQTPRPGQSVARNCYLKERGPGLIRGLYRELSKYDQAKVLEDTMVIRLLQHRGSVSGAICLNLQDGNFYLIGAKAIILCTGGYEQLWQHNDCPPDSTGEGLAMAYQLGAELIDLEMAMFYPCVIIHPYAARGSSIQYEYALNPVLMDGKLLNGNEKVILEGFPGRDEATMAIFKEIEEGRGTPHGGFYMDVSRSPKGFDELTKAMEFWIPTRFRHLKKLGIDLRTDKVEMMPHIHYLLGGIKINTHGETNVKGLFAAGEIAGNYDGANRMSGNALTATQVFGQSAGQKASRYAQETETAFLDVDSIISDEVRKRNRMSDHFAGPKSTGTLRPMEIKTKLQKLMWESVGPQRDEKGLKKSLQEIKRMKGEDLPRMKAIGLQRYCYELSEAYEVEWMLDLAELVVLSAIQRKETRGAHHRMDYRDADNNNWLAHTKIARGADGGPHLSTLPIREKGDE